MTVRVAVVGSGFMARTHLEAYASVPGATPTTVVSRDRDRGDTLAETHSLRWTDSLDQILDDEAIDAVDLCVPTPLHVEMAESCLLAGKAVLVEKPLALDAEGAERLVAASAEADGFLMVGLVSRFWPAYAEMLRRSGPSPSPRVELFQAYRRSPEPNWNSWMSDDRQSGGVALDLMSHDFDLAVALMGFPTEVTARSTPDRRFVHVQLAHDSGVSIIEGSLGMPAHRPFECGFAAIGRTSMLSYSFTAGATPDGGNLASRAWDAGLRWEPFEGPMQQLDPGSEDPFVGELRYFTDCVSTQTPPQHGTVEQAAAAAAVAFATNCALDSGGGTVIVTDDPLGRFGPRPQEG